MNEIQLNKDKAARSTGSSTFNSLFTQYELASTGGLYHV